MEHKRSCFPWYNLRWFRFGHQCHTSWLLSYVLKLSLDPNRDYRLKILYNTCRAPKPQLAERTSPRLGTPSILRQAIERFWHKTEVDDDEVPTKW